MSKPPFNRPANLFAKSFGAAHSSRRSPLIPKLFALCVAAVTVTPALAQQNGTWTSTSDGNWSNSANWGGNPAADGAGNTAFFNTVDLTSNVTVHLDSPRTIGNLNFQDTTAPLFSYTLDNGGNASNILTLDGGTPTITVGSGNTATISAQISGTAGLTKSNSSGVLILTGSNSYSGVTSLNGGSVGYLQITSNAALGASTLFISSQNGGFRFGAAFNDLRDITFGANGGRIDTGAFDITYSSNLSGTITGSFFTKLGTGTLTLAGNNTITGTGGVSVSQGLLQIDSDARLGNGSGALTLNGGGIRYGAAFNDLRSISLGTSGGRLDTNGFDATYSGVLSSTGAGKFIKDGAGALTLTNVNTYTGTTTVNAGVLIVSGSLSASSAVTVGDLAHVTTTAVLAGGGYVGNVTVGASANNTGAILSPGNGAGIATGTTLHTGNLSFLNSKAHLALQIGRTSAGATLAGDVSDHVSVGGSVTLNGADLQLSLLTGTSYNFAQNDLVYLILNDGTDAVSGTFSSLNGVTTNLAEGQTFNFNSQLWQISYLANGDGGSIGNDVAISLAIPEPTTWAMVAAGAGLLVLLQRRRGAVL